MRGFLNLNDENTNYALISPIGSVDGNLDGEKSTILLSSIESQQEKNGDQHTDVSFVGAASIENETETPEDGIKAEETHDSAACVAPIENETAQEERMDETKSIDIEIVTVDPASRPAKQANDSTSPMAVVVDDTENNQTAPSNHCFDVGEYVRVVKGGHKNFGACGKIQKRTKCYVFFLEESTKSTIKITPKFLEDASSNKSLSTMTSPIITSTRGSFNFNDHEPKYALISPVRNVDKDMDGDNTDASFVGAASIENETETSEDGIKACVAPIENETAQEERMDETKSIDIEIVTVDPASRPAKQANDSTSPMAVVVDDTENNQTAPSNHCFDVGEYVRVVKGGHKNFGACGKIQKRTKCYVFFLEESTKSTIKITPKFLEDASSNNSVSTASTVSTSYSDRNVKSAISLGGIDGVGACEGFPGVGLPGAVSSFGLSVEKICFSGNSIKITNAFSNIWDVGSYLPPIEISLELKDPADLPLKLPLDKVYELYYAEVGDDKSGYSSYTKSKKVTAHYVCSESLREHEEKLADFGTLSPSKVWARRKHYLSPAMKLNKEFAVKHISANDLTMIEDVGTVGCGFIQDKYLEDLLGNNAQAKRALGIQIRIFVPTKGVFKGMLMRKRNIGEPIQLNISLRKVAPSRSDDASNDGYIVIKSVFPSRDNFIIGRKFSSPQDLHKKRLKPITDLKGFKEKLASRESCKISKMHVRLLKGLGVSTPSLNRYCREYKENPEKLCHTHLVGMADPTNNLPPNSIFVTGMNGFELDELFVTRSPCMEAKDGRVIKVVRTKPDEMANDDWDFLQSLTFGALIFGDPRPGHRSLPEIIAGGDLDGDLYFVFWDEAILSEIRHIPIGDDELVKPSGAPVREKQYDPEWFSKAQNFISQVPKLHICIDHLVGLCYNESFKVEDIEDQDAVGFARACKQALDVKKHGDLIFLPRHLWSAVPDKLHKYLTEDASASC